MPQLIEKIPSASDVTWKKAPPKPLPAPPAAAPAPALLALSDGITTDEPAVQIAAPDDVESAAEAQAKRQRT